MAIQLEKVHFKDGKKKSLSKESLWEKDFSLNRSHMSSKEKEFFFTELSILLGAGIRLKEALNLIGQSQKKENESERYIKMANAILSGKDFSQVLNDLKDFSSYDVQSIKIGEHTGSLEKVALTLGDFYAKKNELRRTIVGALTYPVIVLLTALLAVLFMLRFVVPMFQDVFRQNNIELPVITTYVIGISDWIGEYGLLCLVVSILLFLLSRVYRKNVIYRNHKDRILLKIPFLGSFLRLVQMARLSQAFSLLISAKISIQESVNLTLEMIDYMPLKDALKNVQSDILNGKLLSDSFKEQSIFDSKMVALLKVAEETNQTENIFRRLNEQYTRDVTLKSKQFATILEPIIILIIGLVVGFILIAMYLPMFELGNVLS
jgi:type IV pilus assembly protein PilC